MTSVPWPVPRRSIGTIRSLQDLAARSAWAAGIGESFYLSDRTEPASDAERTFLQIFSDDLAADGVASGLYIPLKDDEGVVGILVLESAKPDFASPRQQELATILANQATVALRNAQLYNQVPLADALGALHARKEAFLALPKQRRVAMAVAALVAVGALTLIRWPLRVDANAPPFRPTARAEIRPLTDGIIERVLVREGTTVERGRRSSNCVTQSCAPTTRRQPQQRSSPTGRGERGEPWRRGGGTICNVCAPTFCGAKPRFARSNFARRPFARPCRVSS